MRWIFLVISRIMGLLNWVMATDFSRYFPAREPEKAELSLFAI
jgi:hypothetical protein